MNQVSQNYIHRLQHVKDNRIFLECVQEDLSELADSLEETARFFRSIIKPKNIQEPAEIQHDSNKPGKVTQLRITKD
jgi:hypothetical protein